MYFLNLLYRYRKYLKMKLYTKTIIIIFLFIANYNFSQSGHFDSAYVVLNLNDSGSNTWYDLGASLEIQILTELI